VLRTRLIFGVGLIVALVTAIWLDALIEGAAWPFGDGSAPPGVIAAVVVGFLSVVGCIELCDIYRAKGISTSRVLTVLAGWTGLVVCGFVPSASHGVEAVAIAGTAAIVVLVGSMMYYARHEKPEGVVAATGSVLLAFVYLGMALGFVLLLRREHPAWMLLWVLVTTKGCDIGAYFTGRLIGRTKLISWLSPGKTWEGLAGGLVFSGLVGALGAMWLTATGNGTLSGGALGGGGELTPIAGALIGVVLGLVGQMGDLLASLLKRDAGLKDSGRGLPGFGGWLDVLDSTLLAVPVAYWLLKLAG